MLKILTNNCDRETITYIPARDQWINRLYFLLLNESKYSCLTIECRKTGPAIIELMQTVTLNDFFISVKIKKKDFSISFQLKELTQATTL